METTKLCSYSLLSLSKAAKELGIGRDNLNYLIATGKIRVIRVKKQLKIPYCEIERFINENLFSPSNDTFFNQTEFQSNSTPQPTFNSVELFNQMRGKN